MLASLVPATSAFANASSVTLIISEQPVTRPLLHAYGCCSLRVV